MKIKSAPKTDTTFGDLNSGDVFLDIDGDVMMKTAAGFSSNTVVLKDGRQYYFCNDRAVIPVNGTFVFD
ncbi:MAG: hypothetical protein IKZ25_04120 [Clostridia bacterium]|nr:hypothetical protein [Clostridia bacterium]